MGRGYPVPGPDWGVPHPRSGWGVPHPRSGQGVPCPRSRWGGYPVSGLDRGYPIPGPNGRYPHPRSGWGTSVPPPPQSRLDGVIPHPGLDGVTPPLPVGGLIRKASTCYTAGVVPLAFTQEDFLVHTGPGQQPDPLSLIVPVPFHVLVPVMVPCSVNVS